MITSAPVSKDSPLWKAWEAYAQTEDYANTKRWAVHAEHTEGSLWAAFEHGFAATEKLREDIGKGEDDLPRDVEQVADFIGGQNWEANTLRKAAAEIRSLRQQVAAREAGYAKLSAFAQEGINERASLRRRLAVLNAERENIERTLEGAEVPDTVPDDPDETPMDLDSRVEWLADQRNLAESERDEVRQKLSAFRRDDVEILRQMPSYIRGLGLGNDPDGVAHFVAGLADRIEALPSAGER